MTDSGDGMICLHTLNMHYRFTSARIDFNLEFFTVKHIL